MLQGEGRVPDHSVFGMLRCEVVAKLNVVGWPDAPAVQIGMDDARKCIKREDCIDRQTKAADIIAKFIDIGG